LAATLYYERSSERRIPARAHFSWCDIQRSGNFRPKGRLPGSAPPWHGGCLLLPWVAGWPKLDCGCKRIKPRRGLYEVNRSLTKTASQQETRKETTWSSKQLSFWCPTVRTRFHDGIEHEPGGGKALLDPRIRFSCSTTSPVCSKTLKTFPVAELRANVAALQSWRRLQQIPVITTASVPDGPNGPLMPEIHEAAPQSGLCAAQRRGQCLGQRAVREDVARNGQENTDHGRVWTNVCVMFPALDAKAAGLKFTLSSMLPRPERNGIANDARTLHAGWHYSYQHNAVICGSASHLEPPPTPPNSLSSTRWYRPTTEP